MRNTLLLFTLLLIFGCTNNKRDNLFNGEIDDTHLGKGCNYGSSVADAIELCDVYRGNKFASNNNAEIALNKILSVTGMSKRYVLQECTDISNCVATSYKGIRYILYDPEFMDIIATHTNPWSRLAILAHEIGHHVNGHSLDLLVYASKSAEAPTLSESRQMELEADEFSGFVMYKLGASLSQAQEAIKLISTNNDDAYSTHPAKDKRLLAIARGYNNAKKQDANNTRAPQTKETQKENISVVTYDKDIDESGMTAEDYFYLGKSLTKSNEIYANKVDRRRLNPPLTSTPASPKNKFPKPYSFISDRSHSLFEISNNCYSYYTKTIELDPYFIEAYYERAIISYLKKDLIKCMKDLYKVIRLNPNHIEALNLRIWVWELDYTDEIFGDKRKQQINDLTTLIKLAPQYEGQFRQTRAVFYGDIGRATNSKSAWRKSMEDATFVINSKIFITHKRQVYSFRAEAKDQLGIPSCDDWEKACEYEENKCAIYFKKCN